MREGNEQPRTSGNRLPVDYRWKRIEKGFETGEVFGAGNFPGTQAGKVRSVDLAVNHPDSMLLSEIDQTGKAYLGSIRHFMEHGFSKEYFAHCQSIKTTHSFPVQKCFNRVGDSLLMKE